MVHCNNSAYAYPLWVILCIHQLISALLRLLARCLLSALAGAFEEVVSTTQSAETTAVVDSLVSGTIYEFEVVAVSVVGASMPSAFRWLHCAGMV